MATSTETGPPPVKLQLNLADFDATVWQHYITENEQAGIRFSSLAELGDNEANRRRLYELNKECSAGIPGRGPFYSFEEYRAKRLETPGFLPAGVILALHENVWVGMAAVSRYPHLPFAFNEMTGVTRPYRGRGIATALKVLSIRFAQTLDVPLLYSVHAATNEAIIALNRRLGYVDRA